MALNLEKLKDQLKEKSKGNSNLERFEDILVIYLGVEPREYFAKMKDDQGKSIKDEQGKPMREPVASGYTYTFSELGTSKIVKIVLERNVNPQLLGLYVLGGYGYDIKQNSMIFIQESGEIKRYEQS